MNKTRCQPDFFIEPFESYEKNKMHQNGNALTLPVAELAGQAVLNNIMRNLKLFTIVI